MRGRDSCVEQVSSARLCCPPVPIRGRPCRRDAHHLRALAPGKAVAVATGLLIPEGLDCRQISVRIVVVLGGQSVVAEAGGRRGGTTATGSPAWDVQRTTARPRLAGGAWVDNAPSARERGSDGVGAEGGRSWGRLCAAGKTQTAWSPLVARGLDAPWKSNRLPTSSPSSVTVWR